MTGELGQGPAPLYVDFAAREAYGVSPAYERLSYAVSGDDEILALLARLPPAKWQPNLLFGVVRFLGGPVEDPAAFHGYTMGNWPAVEAQLRVRATQTNEAGRCAVLLPVLECAATGVRPPVRVPDVVWRAGLDLNPLDAIDRPDTYGHAVGIAR